MAEYQEALDRLATFLDSSSAGDLINESSGLTVDHLRLILKRATLDEKKRSLSVAHGPENWDGPDGTEGIPTEADTIRGRDANSSPPRATDAEDERWVGEGGGSVPSAHGAGNDGRDYQEKNTPEAPKPAPGFATNGE